LEWQALHDFRFSFFMYSILPYEAVEQRRNPEITIAAGIASFNMRIAFSLGLKTYPDVWNI
jgi:hypothetical protein